MKTTRIAIAGGGFAGLYAAMQFDKRLARRADVEGTLISRENFILFTPMLHEVAAVSGSLNGCGGSRGAIQSARDSRS